MVRDEVLLAVTCQYAGWWVTHILTGTGRWEEDDAVMRLSDEDLSVGGGFC